MGVIKDMIRNWLEIKPSSGVQLNIEQSNDYQVQTFINNIWYRGDSNELQQLYEQINNSLDDKKFWGSKPTTGMNIRKIHTGLPGMIVDALADIATDDLDKIELKERQDEWNEIAKEHDFKSLLRDSVVGALVSGDGAFKWSVDTDISKFPIIEFYDGSRVDFEYERSRLTAIIFKTKKIINKQTYILEERYDKKGISYKLIDKDGKEKNIEDFAELSSYRNVENSADFMMAIPFMFKKSKKYKGRGKSIFDGKIDNFDAFDEIWSQWMLALRKGQIKTYIPDSLLPRDPKTGIILKGNDFDNDFISIEDEIKEDGGSNKIETTQGEIQHEALLSTYITALDQCLTGIISPSTLGIDTKKIDNAEATREKEKTTLYKRDQMISVLEDTIKKIVDITFKVMDNLDNKQIKNSNCTVTFGGYANPSFEAQVETVGKASTTGIMSIEAQIEELWGDTKDEAWKKAEAQRIKEEKGIISVEEPDIRNNIELIEKNIEEGEANDE